MKSDFSHKFAEVFNRNLVLKTTLGSEAETYSLKGCKITNPGSMIHKCQLAKAGHFNVFCLELFGRERGTLSELTGVTTAKEQVKVIVSLKKYLVSAPTQTHMESWKACMSANSSLKTDHNATAAGEPNAQK